MATESPIYSEILRLFGSLDGHKARQIADLKPTLNELEITAAYLAGIDDVMGKQGLPLTGKPALVYDIVIRDEALFEDDFRKD
jgi:hypothetical protein